MTRRVFRAAGLCVSTLVLTAHACGTASGAETKRSRVGDWVVECSTEAPKKCDATQIVVDRRKRQLLKLTLRASARDPYLEVVAPLGLNIMVGVKLIHGKTKDGKKNLAYDLQLVDCYRDGCRSVLALDEKTYKALGGATQIAVQFQDSKSAKGIVLQASATGLPEAVKAVQPPE